MSALPPIADIDFDLLGEHATDIIHSTTKAKPAGSVGIREEQP